ncbi:MAG: hypothetical protein ACXVAX_02695 [Pseudobdellovibrio sp.]
MNKKKETIPPKNEFNPIWALYVMGGLIFLMMAFELFGPKK